MQQLVHLVEPLVDASTPEYEKRILSNVTFQILVAGLIQELCLDDDMRAFVAQDAPFLLHLLCTWFLSDKDEKLLEATSCALFALSKHAANVQILLLIAEFPVRMTALLKTETSMSTASDLQLLIKQWAAGLVANCATQRTFYVSYTTFCSIKSQSNI